MTARWLLPSLMISLAAPALAGPAVTIYTHDLALVREQRALDLTGTRDTVRLSGLPERLDFTSLRLVPAGTARVTRLALRADVTNGDALIDGARGKRVRVTSRGERLTEGTLIASDGSWLVIRGDDGALTTLSRGQVDAVRMADAPISILAEPTLEAAIEGASRGSLSAELSYLTGGLSWSAEHVVVRRGGRDATWSCGVIVQNATGRDFVDADLRLVAGEPQRAQEPPMRIAMMGRAEAKAPGAAADFGEQAFAEYHLYTLDRPATLRGRESQSLSMIAPHALHVTPRYVYRGGDSRGVMSQLEVMNTRENGLGVPLPAGRVRIYESDPSGALQFTGETSIRHTPAGEKLMLDVGSAFDLVAERRQMTERRISDRERETSIEITLRNRKGEDVVITVDEAVNGDTEVITKTHVFTRKDANTLEFTIPVPAGKEAKLAYTIRVRY